MFSKFMESFKTDCSIKAFFLKWEIKLEIKVKSYFIFNVFNYSVYFAVEYLEAINQFFSEQLRNSDLSNTQLGKDANIL